MTARLFNSLFFFFAMVNYVWSQSPKDSLLEWHSQRLLNESDFKSKNFGDSKHEATTVTQIAYNYKTTNGRFESVIIKACFEPYRSWVKSKMSLNLLKHEQLHFDIAELFARRMRAHAKSIDPGKENIEKVKYSLDSLMMERGKLDEKYDNETAHGTKYDMQQKWNEWVAKQLAELKEFELLPPKALPINPQKKSTKKKK